MLVVHVPLQNLHDVGLTFKSKLPSIDTLTLDLHSMGLIYSSYDGFLVMMVRSIIEIFFSIKYKLIAIVSQFFAFLIHPVFWFTNVAIQRSVLNCAFILRLTGIKGVSWK